MILALHLTFCPLTTISCFHPYPFDLVHAYSIIRANQMFLKQERLLSKHLLKFTVVSWFEWLFELICLLPYATWRQRSCLLFSPLCAQQLLVAGIQQNRGINKNYVNQQVLFWVTYLCNHTIYFHQLPVPRVLSMQLTFPAFQLWGLIKSFGFHFSNADIYFISIESYF